MACNNYDIKVTFYLRDLQSKECASDEECWQWLSEYIHKALRAAAEQRPMLHGLGSARMEVVRQTKVS